MSQLTNKLEVMSETLKESKKHILFDSDKEHVNTFVDISTGTQYEIDFNEQTFSVMYFNDLIVNVAEKDLDKYLAIFDIKVEVSKEEVVADDSETKTKVRNFNI